MAQRRSSISKSRFPKRTVVLLIAIVVLSFISTLLFVASARSLHEPISETEALQAWADFQSKVLSKDYEGSREYIYPRYRSRYEESWTKKWYFGAGADSLVLVGLKKDGSYGDLRYRGCFKKSEGTFRFCLIKEGGRTYFTIPAHAMTLDWERRESEHFIFIYDKEKKDAPYGLTYPTDLAVRLMEEHYERFATLLGVQAKEKIEVYIANTPEETARLAGETQKAEGYAQPFLFVVVSTFPFGVMHEVVHVLDYMFLGRQDMTLADYLIHGLPEYGDGSLGSYKGFQATARMKNNLQEGTFKPLREITDYPETAALTQYLIEEHGAAKYRQLLKEAMDNEHFVQSLEQIYGLSMDALEQEWIDWIRRSNTPIERMEGKTIEFRIITDEWERKTIGRYTIWCDTQQEMPSAKDVARTDKLYLNLCRKAQVEPMPHIIFYLANSRNRMTELFRSPDQCYVDGNVMADTTFVGSKLFRTDG